MVTNKYRVKWPTNKLNNILQKNIEYTIKLSRMFFVDDRLGNHATRYAVTGGYRSGFANQLYSVDVMKD